LKTEAVSTENRRHKRNKDQPFAAYGFHKDLGRRWRDPTREGGEWLVIIIIIIIIVSLLLLLLCFDIMKASVVLARAMGP
jgi:hypothetical protein